MELVPLEKKEYEEWDTYALAHPHGSIFHTTRWLANFSGELKVLVQRKKKRIIGGIAFVVSRKFKQKGLHNQPYTPFSGPLFGDLVSEKHFQSITKYYRFVEALSNELRYGQIDFILPSGYSNILPYKWAGFTEEVRVTYKLPSMSMEAYFERLNSNKRREIEKFEPLQESGELVIDTNPDLEEILELQKLTGERSGFNIRENELKNALDGIRDHSYYYALSSKKEGIFSCGVFVYDQHTVYNLINASKRLSHPVYKNANVYLLYLGIKKAFELGLDFDFEGSTVPGVEKFYRYMGGEQHQRFRLQKSRSNYYFFLRMFQQFKKERK